MLRVTHVFRAVTGRSEWPMAAVEALQVDAGVGVRGDHAPEAIPGEFVLFSGEVLAALRRELSVLELEPWAVRAQVLTEGVNLAEWVGRRFFVGGVEVEGLRIRETAPWMDRLVAPGAAAWLQGRAGLVVRALGSGEIRPARTAAPRAQTSGERLAAQWPEHEWE